MQKWKVQCCFDFSQRYEKTSWFVVTDASEPASSLNEYKKHEGQIHVTKSLTYGKQQKSCWYMSCTLVVGYTSCEILTIKHSLSNIYKPDSLRYTKNVLTMVFCSLCRGPSSDPDTGLLQKMHWYTAFRSFLSVHSAHLFLDVNSAGTWHGMLPAEDSGLTGLTASVPASWGLKSTMKDWSIAPCMGA